MYEIFLRNKKLLSLIIGEVVMHGGEGIMRVDLTSRISHEDIHPEIKLKNSVQVYIIIL